MSVLLNQEKAPEVTLWEAVDALRAEGHALVVSVAEEPGAIARLTRESLLDGVDVIVAAGGDGTLNAVVQALHNAEAFDRCALGVLPGGTANDFATACEIPLDDPFAALKVAAEAPFISIDVGRVNDRLFVNAASGGYGAEITATTPPGLKKVLGGFAYLVNGLLHIPEVEGKQACITAPGFEWQGKMVGFTVGNGRLAGGGFSVAPHALLNDGLLDLTLFPEVTGGGWWIGVVGDLFRPDEDGNPANLVTCQASWLDITVHEALHLNLDGEPIQDTSFRFDVLPARARFCLPPSALVQR